MGPQRATGVVGFGSYGYSPAVNKATRAYYASHSPAMMISEASAPSAALYRHLAHRPPSAMGNNGAAAAGMSVVLIGGLVALAVAVNYQLGKAMAPRPSDEGTWAWGNAIGGTIFPPLTVGLAVYKNYFL